MNIDTEYTTLFEKLGKRCSLCAPIPYSFFLNASLTDKPEIIISVGVHGNEWKIVEGLFEFLAKNVITKKILFIISNPKALEKEVRFIDYDLNRIFYSEGQGAEFVRAEELLSITSDCKYFLDLHLTQQKTLKKYGIFETTKNNMVLFTSMNDGITDIISSTALNDKGLCFDEAVLSKNPSAVALTLELGSILDEEQKIVDTVKTVVSEFIAAIDSTPIKKEVTIWEQRQFVKNTPENALVEGLVNFQEVSKGFVLTKSGIVSEYDGVLLFPKYSKTTDTYILRVAIRR